MALDRYYISNEGEWIEFWENLNEDWDSIDLGPAMADQLGVLEEAHSEYFASAVDPGGNPWPALAQSTIDQKGHDTILVDTSRLRVSLTEPTGPDAVRLVEENGAGWELTFGTGVEYSIYHDEATANRPARPHVGWDEPLFEEIAENVLDAAEKEFSDA